MATSVQSASAAVRTNRGVASDWLSGRAGQLVVAALVYLAVDLIYFGTSVLPHLGSACACGTGSDPTSYMWFLGWWPHALLHGLNPFTTNALFAPDHVNLGAVDEVPGAALLAAPVTLLFGPLAAYNLVALAAPVLAATFAFLLFRYVTGRFLPALVGGYIFGFSPYMLGHMQGHLDLIQIFPIPAAIHLTLRRMDGNISTRWFVGLLALLLAYFFLCSQELTVTFVLTSALALILAYGFAASARPRIRQILPQILGAGAIAVVLVGVFIYYALTGDLTSSFFNRYSDTVVADGLGFVVPTDAEALGHTWFDSVSAKFSGGIPENGVYVGLPLVLITLSYVVARWRRPATRVLVCLLALIVVLMLGSHLRIAGNNQIRIGSHHTIPLPWYALEHLPFLHEIAPARLGVYMFLIVGLITSMWLASSRRDWRGGAKWAVAALGIVLLVPNLASGGWKSNPDNPPLFTDARYQPALPSGKNVLALPFAYSGNSMLWQAEAGFKFRLAEGYVGALIPPDYARDVQGVAAFANPGLAPDPAALRAYLEHRHVEEVVLDPTTAPQWPAALAALGLTGRRAGGTLIYHVRTP